MSEQKTSLSSYKGNWQPRHFEVGAGSWECCFSYTPSISVYLAARQSYCSQHVHGELPVKAGALLLLGCLSGIGDSIVIQTQTFTAVPRKKQGSTWRHLLFHHCLHLERRLSFLHPQGGRQSTKSLGVSWLNLFTGVLLHSEDDVYRDRMINAQRKQKGRRMLMLWACEESCRFSFGIVSNIPPCLTSKNSCW